MIGPDFHFLRLIPIAAIALTAGLGQARAQVSEAVREQCRQTVMRPLVQNCMRTGGGDRDACREMHRPKMQECMQRTAGSGKADGARSTGAPKGENRQSPQGPPAFASIGRARDLMKQGKYQSAISELDQAVNKDPNSAAALAWRGRAYGLLGQHAQAIPDLDQALKIDPNNGFALVNRGYSQYATKDNGGALVYLNKAVELDPSNPGAYAVRGLIYSDMGEQDRAMNELNKAVQLGPNYAAAYGNRGLVHNKLRQYDRAVADYTKALQISPNGPNFLSGRGFGYLNLGDTERALADLNAALAMAPKSIRALTNRARIYFEQAKYDAAIKDLDVVLSIEPRNVTALVGRARSLEMAQNLKDANADFQAALDIIPTHGVALAGRERIQSKIAAASGAPRTASDRAGVRVALVIGNSRYQATAPLTNPERDARLIAESLNRSGFEKVRLMIDGTREDIAGALKSFSAEAANADWAVVYYAGHGLELDGSNYLVPVDFKLQGNADVAKQSIALDQILNSVRNANKLRLVILDACRDNPFVADLAAGEAAVVGRGLARIEPESGTLVAFATKHGHVAADGAGANSPFATALVKRMPTPGLEINLLFRLVHDDVYTSTNKEQEPFTYGQLSAQGLYFKAL
ncbi:MAG: tetratricopeptide repeat protein [Pseudomonadota bacterium]